MAEVVSEGDYPGLYRWALNGITSILIREKQGVTTHTEEDRDK